MPPSRLAARRGANPLPPPRHVRPGLAALGQALAFDHLFWDGRVFVDRGGKLHTPASVPSGLPVGGVDP